MTSKERAELKTQAVKLDSIFQIGKSSLTPQFVEAIRDALTARELIKISVLKNCGDNPQELAQIVAERTGSQVVQVIGKKIILYKKNPDKQAKKKLDKENQDKQAKKKPDKDNQDKKAKKKPDKDNQDKKARKKPDKDNQDKKVKKSLNKEGSDRRVERRQAAQISRKRERK